MSEEIEQTPYDFSSITHYNSDAMQVGNRPTIVSKLPMLLSPSNTLDIERNTFSKIDILKIQRLYGCQEIERPEIRYAMDANDLKDIEEITKRLEKN